MENGDSRRLVSGLPHGLSDDFEKLSDCVGRVADDLPGPQASEPSQRQPVDLHSPLVDGAFVALLGDALHARLEGGVAASDSFVAAQLVLSL